MTEDKNVLVITYSQLAYDSELIAEAARRAGKTLVVGDEIHHADEEEKFGKAVQILADACIYKLALSGTPFNSTGGALALCDHEDVVSPEGKPLRKTISTVTYSLGEAITDRVCRTVEFMKVSGRGEFTYRSLSNSKIFNKIIDLTKQRKGDRISALLDPDGEFMEECARQAVLSLAALHDSGDKKAAMLVVAKNREHGKQLAKLLKRICAEEKRSSFSIGLQEIYNITEKAHQRIEDLKTDTTDIVVSVRMISEGVNVKRFRVGLFATDWMTRMFFIQFVGRFVRYESRLDEGQYACVIIPAHILLLEYAMEIEKLIEEAIIKSMGDGEAVGGDNDKVEFIKSTTEANPEGIIYRGIESNKLDLAEALYKIVPNARGSVPRALAIELAEKLGIEGASPDRPQEKKKNWSSLNDAVASEVVKRLRSNENESDSSLYARVNGRANSFVGILKKDKLTAEDILIRRHQFLVNWLKRLLYGQEIEEDLA